MRLVVPLLACMLVACRFEHGARSDVKHDASPVIDVLDAPPISPDADGCDEACAAKNGVCQSGVCTIVAGAGNVACPAGFPCVILCSAAGSCNANIDCGMATSCTLDCTGSGACSNAMVDCTDGPCSMKCKDGSSCNYTSLTNTAPNLACKLQCCGGPAKCVGNSGAPNLCELTANCP